ncbi:hypothetical protein [uncultured Umboniibacter sp.]|uniref:hypothetical protein n=1 Tax=uncultured Umboniibacter sp. TaxID=1798917 RepID=UPI002627DADF|nr:hypothetical protein [uncultured Umboniibacter sp.]
MKLAALLSATLISLTLASHAEVSQSQEITIEVEERADSSADTREIHLNLEVNGETAELVFNPEMVATQEGRDALIADLPPSLQTVLGRELGRLASEMGKLELDINIEVDGERHEVRELVWLEEGSDDNVFEHKVVMIDEENHGSEADLIVRLIERAELSEEQINQILSAVEAKLE